MARKRRIVDGRTVGVSPKVGRPTLVGLIVALLLFLAGLDQEALTVALAALGYGGIGAVSEPGEVESK